LWRLIVIAVIFLSLTGCRTDAGGEGGLVVSPTISPSPLSQEETMSAEERAEMLRLVRETITTYLVENRVPAYHTDNPRFLRDGGTFVTLKKQGQLRGCIGYIWSQDPLYQTVQRAAVAAATQDPRFPPVTLGEMGEIAIEVSLLSPMEPVEDPDRIEVGKHGLLIRQGYYQGLLLPQVAPEQGWDREQFLEGVCRKAGLPRDAWRDPQTELLSFTAEVFGEE
jgi:AmmeMemoRadiSam system protein A